MKHLISEYFAYQKEKQFLKAVTKLIELKYSLINGENENSFLTFTWKQINADIDKLFQSKITNNEQRQS